MQLATHLQDLKKNNWPIMLKNIKNDKTLVLELILPTIVSGINFQLIFHLKNNEFLKEF